MSEPIRDSEPIGNRVSIFQRGRKWYANYQLDGRQQRVSLKTTNKKEARSRAMKIEVQLEEGTHQAKVNEKSIEEGKKLYLDQLKVIGRAKKQWGSMLWYWNDCWFLPIRNTAPSSAMSIYCCSITTKSPGRRKLWQQGRSHRVCKQFMMRSQSSRHS